MMDKKEKVLDTEFNYRTAAEEKLSQKATSATLTEMKPREHFLLYPTLN
jgi:hypothetical protein